ncbi:MAG: substrate-binding periplasmic protein [Pseudomonadota bacterium]
MKRMRTCCCLLLLCWLAGLHTAVADDTQIRFLFAYEDRELYPFYAGDGEMVPVQPGVYIELIQQVARRHPQLRLELQRMPWKRCLISLMEGRVDALVASYRGERQQNGVYPLLPGQQPPAVTDHRPPPAQLRISAQTYALYRHRDAKLDWNGSAFLDLNGAIGAPRGYSIVDDLRKLGVTVEESDNIYGALKKLQLKRLAGVAAFDVVADQYISHSEFAELERVATPLVTKDYFLMLSHTFVRDHPAVAQALWQSLAELREQESAALYRRYLR